LVYRYFLFIFCYIYFYLNSYDAFDIEELTVFIEDERMYVLLYMYNIVQIDNYNNNNRITYEYIVVCLHDITQIEPY
jgi:hypothetical protein